jgi:hypothetical protein
VKTTRRRHSVIAAAAVTVLLAVAACTAAGPTDIIVYLTPTPAPITPTPEITPTPTPTPNPTPTPTPAESGSPKPSATPKPTPTPSPTPTPGPGGPAASCTGSAGNRDFFVQAANVLQFKVYCAKLPTGWYFASASYEQPNGGFLKVSYKGPNGATFSISEGAFCSGTPSACSPHDAAIGSAKFGDQGGTLDSLSGGFVIYVAPATLQAYSASAKGMTQATFVAYAVALTRVPKS